MAHNKIICSKHDVLLGMVKSPENDEDVSFTLEFDLHNENIDLHNVLGFKLYELINTLNKDIVDDVIFSTHPKDGKNYIESLVILKRFGEEFGIPQKYIYSKTNMIVDDEDTVRFVAEQLECPDNITLPNHCEPVSAGKSTLKIVVTNNNTAKVLYNFDLKLDDNVPKYMEKMPGLLMKKMFMRLKTFIENLA